jgi:trehalose monomycolate/heme transporter
MFSWIGRTAYRRRRSVLAMTGAFLVLAVTWGTGVFGSLVGGGFDDPASESARAVTVLEESLGRSASDVVLLYSADAAPMSDPAVRAAVSADLAALPADEVVRVVSPYDNPSGVSVDGRQAYAVVQLAGEDEEARFETFERIEPALVEGPEGVTVALGGNVPTFNSVSEQIEADIARAEMLSFPVLMVLLVIVFGGVVAASLPLLIGGLAILGAFTALHLMTLVTDVSVFSINIVTLLGLGLAIDYSLFVVSRFREELRAGHDTPAALERTMATAGRTVAFSGLTVAISLAGLLIFPQVFLRSMGFGGMAAVLVAMIGALTVLPALLAVLGHRVNALQVPALRRWKERRALSPENGAWAHIARGVMRRPVVVLLAVVPLLLLLGSPFLGVRWSTADASSLPSGTEPRVVAETLQTGFGSDPTGGLAVALTGADASEAASYADAVAVVPGVDAVTPNGSNGTTSRLDVALSPALGGAQSDAARDVLDEIRAVPAPAGGEALVVGMTAELTDLLNGLGDRLPLFLGFVATTTFLLLFLAFGSVLLPIKAVLMNLLSLTASFGAVVWIFQEGHLTGLLGVDTVGSIEATQPVLMLAIAFGLSMDYEVFLLSRIREEYDRTGDTRAAVAAGLQRTGGLITAAAILLTVVIGAFATSGIVFIQMIGVGLAIAIIMDATVVRGLVVPALMRLMGDANWWAPAPLARLWLRVGLREGEAAPPPVALPAPRAPEETSVGV